MASTTLSPEAPVRPDATPYRVTPGATLPTSTEMNRTNGPLYPGSEQNIISGKGETVTIQGPEGEQNTYRAAEAAILKLRHAFGDNLTGIEIDPQKGVIKYVVKSPYPECSGQPGTLSIR